MLLAALHAAPPGRARPPPSGRGAPAAAPPASGFAAPAGAALTAAALAATALAARGQRLRGSGADARRRGRRAATAAGAPTARPPREAPTPYPVEEIFPQEVVRILDILDERRPREDELVEALGELQDLHEYDRQWVIWPFHVNDVGRSPYNRGLFQLLRGILRCIEKARGGVRAAAVDLFYSLCVGGSNVTRVPPTFVVECGAVGVLCKAARETSDQTVFEVLTEVTRMAPNEMLPAVIEGGAIDAALKTIEEAGFEPLEQLAALDLILSLARRAPARTARAGAFEAVKVVSNEALVSRRNKIMNLLRPIVEQEGEQMIASNIRIGGLKF